MLIKGTALEIKLWFFVYKVCYAQGSNPAWTGEGQAPENPVASQTPRGSW